MVASVTAFVDYTAIIIVLVVMLSLDLIGYFTHVGVAYVGAGVLGMATDGWIFKTNNIVQQTNCVLSGSTCSYVNNNVDPNLMVVVIAIVTVISFSFVFYEKNSR